MPLWRACIKNLAPVLFLSCASCAATVASAQTTAVPPDVQVSLTQASYLPVVSQGSINTTIATALGKQSSAPWQVSLTLNGQDPDTGGQNYQVRVTNTSSAPLHLPVGNNGGAIWSACQNVEIDEVNISLTVAGQAMPVAHLPSSHSCGAVSSSSLTVVPGASVVFQGTLAGGSLPVPQAGVSAVLSVCSAVYQLAGDNPQTTRSCQAPVSSISSAPPASSSAASSSPVGNLT